MTKASIINRLQKIEAANAENRAECAICRTRAKPRAITIGWREQEPDMNCRECGQPLYDVVVRVVREGEDALITETQPP